MIKTLLLGSVLGALTTTILGPLLTIMALVSGILLTFYLIK